MKFYPLISLIAGSTCFFFALIVIFKGKNKQENRTFFLASTFTGIWTLFPFLTSLPANYNFALQIARILYFFAAFVPTTWYYFMVNLLEIPNNKRKTIIFLGLSIVFAFLSFTPLIVKNIVRFAPNFHVQAGSLYFLFIIFFLAVFSDIIIKLYQAFKIANGYRKSQIFYVCGAYVAGVISGALHFFSAYTGKEPISHDIFIILYPIIITYSITKYRFLDIKVLITRTGIFVAVYTLVLGLPFLLAVFYKNKFILWLGVNWWVGPLLLMALLATSGTFLFIYLQKRAEVILLQEQHNYQKILRQTAAGITRIHNLNNLLTLIVKTITRNVGVSNIAIYLSDNYREPLILKTENNPKNKLPRTLERNNLLISWLTEHKVSLVSEEIKRKDAENPNAVFNKLFEQMRLLTAAVIIPNYLDDKLIGVFVLGEKTSRKIYSSEDLHIFSVLASQFALAIENALLYENIEGEIKKRTKELVEVQQQLVQAEKLATVGTLAGGVAHEINNPLTVILTNVQMLLTSNEPDKESLEMIEEATKRCRTIVQKLMAYAKKPQEIALVYQIDLLENVIKSTVNFLKFQLEQENIKIIITAENQPYLVKGNHNELEQVITNLILNAKDAIKMVKKNGAIEIGLIEDSNWIKILIKDDGSGIRPEIVKRIFDPFFTTKDVGKGLGLGLSICQSIIEKHNGKIAVESKLNIGSIFTVELPKFSKNILKDEKLSITNTGG